MLRGQVVGLRAVERADVEVLAGWELEPETWRLAADGAYVPTTVATMLAEFDAGKGRLAPAPHQADFVVDVDGACVGRVTLWGIDAHNRRAHLGIAMAPHARGKGWGTDACRVLLAYAFRDRGLHRVQLETLAGNAPALAAYRRAGFIEEGRLREDAWVDGRFVEQVVMGVLATEWRAAQPASDAAPG